MIDTSLASTMYRVYYRSDDSTGCLGGLMFPLELKSSFTFFFSLFRGFWFLSVEMIGWRSLSYLNSKWRPWLIYQSRRPVFIFRVIICFVFLAGGTGDGSGYNAGPETGRLCATTHLSGTHQTAPSSPGLQFEESLKSNLRSMQWQLNMMFMKCQMRNLVTKISPSLLLALRFSL